MKFHSQILTSLKRKLEPVTDVETERVGEFALVVRNERKNVPYIIFVNGQKLSKRNLN